MQTRSGAFLLATTAVLSGCADDATGRYVTDMDSLVAALHELELDAAPGPAGEAGGGGDPMARLAAPYRFGLLLHADGRVDAQTVADEFLDCGSWRQSGRDVTVDLNITGERQVHRMRQVRGGLSMRIGVLGREVALLLRRQP